MSFERGAASGGAYLADERVEMIQKSVSNLASVAVEHFDGLLMNYANKKEANVIVRGLRAITDFEFEFQMALVNRRLAEHVVTVFLMPNEKYTYLNSTIVKEVAKFDGDVRSFVPKDVDERLRKKFNQS